MPLPEQVAVPVDQRPSLGPFWAPFFSGVLIHCPLIWRGVRGLLGPAAIECQLCWCHRNQTDTGWLLRGRDCICRLIRRWRPVQGGGLASSAAQLGSLGHSTSGPRRQQLPPACGAPTSYLGQLTSLSSPRARLAPPKGLCTYTSPSSITDLAQASLHLSPLGANCPWRFLPSCPHKGTGQREASPKWSPEPPIVLFQVPDRLLPTYQWVKQAAAPQALGLGAGGYERQCVRE